ncbi:MAG: hypothetical protein B0A82_26150 [Alkalinema sp. CACIAM 70d]|nr:MAG: hypothetical protein B0A82_26150 [Alkalinema sp. CACIAM 70d]
MTFRFRSQSLWLSACFGLLGLNATLLQTPAFASSSSSGNTVTVSRSTEASGLAQGRDRYRAGQFAEAILAWKAAAQQYQTSGDRLNQALALSYVSLGYQELSQWQEAEAAIQESLKLLKAATPAADAILWAQSLNTQAKLLLSTGKAQAALETWQQAQKYYEQAGDRIGSIGSQINQAQALQTLGFYRRSRQQLEALNQSLKAMPDSEVKVSGLRSLGSALYMIGANADSQKVLEEGLEIARKLNLTTEVSDLLQNLGRATADLGNPDEALHYFEEADQAATSPLDRLQSRLQRFKLFADYGLTNEAAPLAPQILEQIQQLPASRTSLYTAINFAATLNRFENPAQAVSIPAISKLLEKTVRSAQQLQDQQAEAHALNQWSQWYQRTQQWNEAKTLSQQSLQLARQIQANDIIAQSTWQLGKLNRIQGNRSEAISDYTEAVKALQAMRGDLVAVNPDMQFSFRESVEPVYRELVALLLEGQPSQENLVHARDLIESLQVAELDNFFREACLDKTQQIDQIDPTATVVYPIILPDRLAIIHSTAGQPLRYYSTPKPQAEVEQTLTEMLAALSPVSNVKDRNRLSKQLYDWLIRPAEEAQALKNTKTLVFVLDGRLRNIPMAALYDGKQYLIEKYAVTLSPGLQLMASQSLNPNQIDAIVGGISESRSGFAALPGVEAEVKKISKTVPSSTLFNQQFTGQALSQEVNNSQANVVHLATHGQFSSRMEDTFLLTWDGQVNVKELSELLKKRQGDTTKPIELLVLSACDTATGDDRAVLGLAGLAVKSGARSTIASLWPVKDNAASQLMTNFYQQLRKPGISKAEALRQAQLELIQKTDFRDPFFWSAFVLVGNWQ